MDGRDDEPRIPGLAQAAYVIGESLVDIKVDPDGTEHRLPGGSPMNVAFGLARLGVPTRLRSVVGDDPDGHLVIDHLRSAGVKLGDLVVLSGGRTSTARATIDQSGGAKYEFDLHWELPSAGSVPRGYGVLHTGSIGSILRPGADDVLALFESARPEVIRSFDPNVRPAITGDRNEVLARVERLARLTDVLKLSDEDAGWLYPGLSAAGVADTMLGFGVKLFVMTRGSKGCSVVTPSHRFEQRAIQTHVVDTIGAGDAFMSALLASLSRWGLFGRLREDGVSVGDLRRLAAFAARAAALTVAQAGAQPPTWTQVRATA